MKQVRVVRRTMLAGAISVACLSLGASRSVAQEQPAIPAAQLKPAAVAAEQPKAAEEKPKAAAEAAEAPDAEKPKATAEGKPADEKPKEEKPKEEKKDEKKETSLPPELEKKLDLYFEKIGEAKAKFWNERLAKTAEEMSQATGLSEAGKQELVKLAPQVVERSMKGWLEKLNVLWREQMKMNVQPKQLSRMLDQMIPQAAQFGAQEFPGDYKQPEEDEAWVAAVARVFTPEQKKIWEAKVAERRIADEKEIADVLKANLERVKQQMGTTLGAKVGDMKASLGLTPERAKTLDELAKAALDASCEVWQKKTTKQVLLMPAEQRKQMLGRGQVYFGWEEGDMPMNQEVWKTGLKKMFTEDEWKRMTTAKEESKARRVRIFGRILLAELDERLAFTAAQREKLAPIMERLVKGQAQFFPEDDGQNYRSYPLQAFYAAAFKATPEELKPILDEAQMKRWKEICVESPNGSDGMGRRGGDDDSKPDEKPVPGQPPPDPEEFENAVSDFLVTKVDARRKALLAPLILKAEDASRVAAISPEAVSRLQTAARGAVEEQLVNWKSQTEVTVRSNLSGTGPAGVRRRLNNMEEYQFNSRVMSGTEMPIWDKMVKLALTPEQLEKWKTETDARLNQRNEIIADAILVEFDSRVGLTQEQWKKLQPILSKIVQEYTPEITNYFSGNEGEAWYMQYYTKFVPCAGIPEAEMKGTLTKEQWDRWTGLQEYSNAVSSWDSIKQQNEQRKKRAKQ